MIQINMRIPAAVVLLFLSFLSSAMAGSAVDVEAPWVREAPPASTVLAAYMVVKNTSDTVHTITRIDSPDFRDARIHRTVVEDGVAKMLLVEQLQLPVNGSITLEPGGLHLMLYDPQRPLRDGDSVTLVIHDSDGGSITVTAPVVRKTGGHDHSHHH
ncbi:MAG: copper chaperone PCu(A)C [Pseudomonadota bacterium]